jgi:hypothetical protein
LGIFISLVYLLIIYYHEKTAALDFKTWDVNTVTAADFTAETFFTDELWEDYLLRPDAQALTTKDRIKHFEGLLRMNLIEMLENESFVLYDSKIKIAHVTFSFENVKIMNLLS